MINKHLETARHEICQRCASAFVPPEDMVAVALKTLGQQPIFAERIVKGANDNISWFIYCGDFEEDADFFQPVHTTHLATILPTLLPYLALAEGAHLIIDNEGYEDVWWDDEMDSE